MKRRQISFYATIADVRGLNGLLAPRLLQFLPRDVPAGSEPVALLDLTLLNPFQAYVVLPFGNPVLLSKVETEDGEIRCEVSLELNPGSALLHLGGFKAEDRILPGQFGIGHADPKASATFKLFSDVIRKNFEKIKSYYVGPEAARLLDRGMRLSPTEKSPETYDLVR
jgi:hypothetical protein